MALTRMNLGQKRVMPEHQARLETIWDQNMVGRTPIQDQFSKEPILMPGSYLEEKSKNRYFHLGHLELFHFQRALNGSDFLAISTIALCAFTPAPHHLGYDFGSTFFINFCITSKQSSQRESTYLKYCFLF